MLIGDDLNGRTIDLGVHETLEIRLPENPTAGFRWDVVAGGAPACALRNDDFVAADGLPGAGGQHRWIFEALQPGECEIELVYHRRWTGASEPERRFRVRLKIGDGRGARPDPSPSSGSSSSVAR